MMAENACDAAPVIFTEFNWIAHCGEQSGTDTVTDLKISKVLLICSVCVYSLANCSTTICFVKKEALDFKIP